jgi:hypothetical protein
VTEAVKRLVAAGATQSMKTCGMASRPEWSCLIHNESNVLTAHVAAYKHVLRVVRRAIKYCAWAPLP